MKRKRWSEDMEKDNSNEQKNQNSSIFNSQEGLDILITAIEQTSVAMVITDLKADIIYVNNAFEKMTGYTKEEAIGQNPRILKSGLVAQEEYEKLWDVISNGGTWNGEQINKKKMEAIIMRIQELRLYTIKKISLNTIWHLKMI